MEKKYKQTPTSNKLQAETNVEYNKILFLKFSSIMDLLSQEE